MYSIICIVNLTCNNLTSIIESATNMQAVISYLSIWIDSKSCLVLYPDFYMVAN